MYLAADPRPHHDLYFQIVKDVMQAAPSTGPYIDAINSKILTGEMYKALKEARKLIEYERGLLENVKGS
jgi:flagellar protein FlbT